MHLRPELRLIALFGILAAYGCGSTSSNNSPSASATSKPDSPQQANPVQTAATPAEVARPLASTVPLAPPKPAAEQVPATPPSASVEPRPKAPPTPSADQIAKWKIPAYEPMQLLACHDGFGDPAVLCMAVSPDGKQFVLGGARLTLWNTRDSKPAADLLAKYQGDQVERPIRAAAISADGKWLAAGDGKGKVRIWTLSDQKEVAVIQAHQGHITELAFSPDSRLLATTSYAGDVTVWQLPEGKKLKTLKMSKQEIPCLVFVSKNQLASASNEANIWNVETATKETALTTKRLLGPALGLSSDGRLLAFNDGEGTVRFWDVSRSKPAEPPLRGAAANRIAFSPNGKRIATHSGHSEIRIWDATGSVLQVIDAIGGRTAALAWLPGSNALLIATEYGRVRLWGAPDAAAMIGIRPLVIPPLAPAAARRSLSSAQLEQVIDLRSFPRLPGAVPGWGDGGMCSYTAPISQAEAELFYRYVAGKAGWTEVPASPMAPGLVFEKNGCRLNVSFGSAAAEGTGRAGDLQVSLHFPGNYDVRWLPKFSAAESKSAFDSFSHVMYRTKAEMTDVEAALLKQCHTAGWTAYTRLAASGQEDPNSRTISMLQAGSELTVSIGYPADSKDELFVTTSVHLLKASLPLPPDSGWIEFDASTDLQLVVNTKMDLKQTIDFYDQQMAADGWLAREPLRQVKDDTAWLPYIRGQQDVYLRLSTMPGGGTRLVVGDAASSSWQLRKPPAEEPAGSKGKPGIASPKPGIEAAVFTLPAGATAVKFDVDAKRIDFEAPVPPPKLGEQFVKQMESLQWKREGAGIVADDYTFITFKKGKIEIQLRARPAGKNSTAMISGDGLLWTKPLPTAPVRISYETWLRRNRKEATLDLLDEFVAEMHKIPAQAGK